MATQGQASRSRAVAILVFVAVVVVALAIGLAYLVSGGSRSTGPGASGAPASSPTATGVDNTSAEDELANRPMLTLPISAAQPQPMVSDVAGPPIEVPASTSKIVPGGPPVATGFPHTPEGALGQLAAIDEAALSTTDLGRVHEVYAWAALSGAVDENQWSPHHGIATLIDHLGGTAKAMQAHATFQVVEGQIKGTVGPNFVVVCVLGEMDVTAASSARAGVGDCQRMVWREGRWWIGPGSQPAYAPSAWPGSADAVRAGWRELKRAS
jgi:hypothetical protein